MAFVTLPKVLGACPQGFDPAHYDFDAEREELAAQDKLVRLDNMIRWRYKTRADGTPVLDAQGRKVVRALAAPRRALSPPLTQTRGPAAGEQFAPGPVERWHHAAPGGPRVF